MVDWTSSTPEISFVHQFYSTCTKSFILSTCIDQNSCFCYNEIVQLDWLVLLQNDNVLQVHISFPPLMMKSCSPSLEWSELCRCRHLQTCCEEKDIECCREKKGREQRLADGEKLAWVRLEDQGMAGRVGGHVLSPLPSCDSTQPETRLQSWKYEKLDFATFLL